jgi:hypothetical protein
MRLEFHRGVRLLVGLVLTVGVIQFSLGVVALCLNWPLETLAVCLTGGTFLPVVGIALLLLPSVHEFDRVGGSYVRRSVVLPLKVPLSQIVAVQFIPGTPVDPDPDSNRKIYWNTYQLNLVIWRDNLRRESIFCGCDQSSICEAAQRLSSFLGIPLLTTAATAPLRS